MANILVTGGAGYVGAVLVPKLIRAGHQVSVLDLYLYGDDVFQELSASERTALKEIKGDIRNQDLLRQSLPGHQVVIHLACISNDPSFELNPTLGKSINLDAFRPLVEISKAAGVQRFIYASSSSVYGVKSEAEVNEQMSLEPLTDYSRFKADCEKILAEYQGPDFTTLTIRPATVCGYSPRQRLDVIVNILTNHAFHNRRIQILGGAQLRPNIHIDDMADLYVDLVEIPKEKIAGKIYNFGFENHSVEDLGQIVRRVLGNDIEVIRKDTNDPRSYHISSKSIMQDLGIGPKKSIEDAVVDLKRAFEQKKLTDGLTNKRYFNIQTMIEAGLQ